MTGGNPFGLIPTQLEPHFGPGSEDRESLWADVATELEWFSEWDRVCHEPAPGSFDWFSGATTNICYNCLDRPISNGAGDRTALVYESGEVPETERLTYAELRDKVEATAGMLRGLNIAPGDTVTIFMPTCLEAAISMLACTRIGAVHVMVSTGFGTRALAQRIEMADSRVLLTADAGFRRGERIDLHATVSQCLEESAAARETIEHIVSTTRGERQPGDSHPRFDIPDVEFTEWDVGHPDGSESDGSALEIEATEPAMVMYTSGSTGRPKGVVHQHGGYQVYLSAVMRWLFGAAPEEVLFVPADLGWAVTQGYGLYGALLTGATSILFEGVPTYPDAKVWWRTIDRNDATRLLTAPTALRSLQSADAGVDTATIESLDAVFSGGEPLNRAVWSWFQSELPEGVPVIDYYGQTETGGAILGNPIGIERQPIKPGTVTLPIPGVELDILDDLGESVGPGETGDLVVERSFPGLTPTLLEGHDRYLEEYWTEHSGRYVTGDLAHRDEDGYVTIVGRRDDVITISGHRIGPAEVENAVIDHPSLAEVAAIGRPDPERTEVIVLAVRLQSVEELTDELAAELMERVHAQVGPIAVVDEVVSVDSLPKTETGKLTRREMRQRILDDD